VDNERLGRIDDELVSLGLKTPEHVVSAKKTGSAPAGIFDAVESDNDELKRCANQAWACLDAGRPDEAVASAEKGLSMDPDFVELLEIKSDAAMKLGAYDKASEAMKALASLTWDHRIRIQRLFRLSEILIDRMNDRRGGFDALREILMLDGSAAGALEKAESVAIKAGLHKEFVELTDLLMEKIGIPPASDDDGKLLAALLIGKGRFYENALRDTKSALNCYSQAVYYSKDRAALEAMKRVYMAMNMKKAADEIALLMSEIT